MLDLIYLALGLGMFGLLGLYAMAATACSGRRHDRTRLRPHRRASARRLSADHAAAPRAVLTNTLTFRRSSDDRNWLAADRAHLRARAREREAARRCSWRGCSAMSARFLTPCSARSSAASIALAGVDAKREQSWLGYTLALLIFSAAGFVLLYAILRLQHLLPLNPQGFDPMSPHLAFNTAASLRHQHQLAELRRRNHAVLLQPDGRPDGAELRLRRHRLRASPPRSRAPSRAAAPAQSATSGSISPAPPSTCCCRCRSCSRSRWSRSACRRTCSAYVDATTLEGAKQTLAQGPVASQVAIKQLGTNGGGFFNVNAAHPYENPNLWTNLLQTWAIFSLVASALAVAFGRMIGNERAGLGAARRDGAVPGRRLPSSPTGPRPRGNPLMHAMGVTGGNMEGKEVRFGTALSALWARVHHRRLQRLGQLHARLLHAARRPGAARCSSRSARWCRAASAPASTASSSSRSSPCSSPG